VRQIKDREEGGERRGKERKGGGRKRESTVYSAFMVLCRITSPVWHKKGRSGETRGDQRRREEGV
jgi:hypothetical protein